MTCLLGEIGVLRPVCKCWSEQPDIAPSNLNTDRNSAFHLVVYGKSDHSPNVNARLTGRVSVLGLQIPAATFLLTSLNKLLYNSPVYELKLKLEILLSPFLLLPFCYDALVQYSIHNVITQQQRLVLSCLEQVFFSLFSTHFLISFWKIYTAILNYKLNIFEKEGF